MESYYFFFVSLVLLSVLHGCVGCPPRPMATGEIGPALQQVAPSQHILSHSRQRERRASGLLSKLETPSLLAPLHLTISGPLS